ncbi:hypothetical protein GCM10017673_37930 [Streptosporangium violaceochromogenes]|nr:hypothetical protein GCM10017673_37930 [Streptosporangium violaceochromogenes]
MVGGMAPYGQYSSDDIAAELATQIETGEYPPGTRLPSETELRTHYGVAKLTVRAVLAKLGRWGLVDARRGGGVFVRRYERRPLSLSAAAGGREQFGGQLDVRFAPPPDAVADLLPGVTSVWWRRTHGQALTDTYYPQSVADLVPELRHHAPLPEPDIALLERAGMAIERRPTRILSRMPTMAEEHLFATPPNTPLTEITEALVTGDGRTVAARVTLAPGDQFVLELVL